MKIKMLVLDVDGTMTDGKIILSFYKDEVIEFKNFNSKDGLGIAKWIKSGRLVSIISGRDSEIVIHRAEELGIQEVFLGINNKAHILEQIAKKYDLSYKNMACIGDDINDLDMFKHCKYSFAPSNSHELNKKHASFVLNSSGGDGAIREMIDRICFLENINIY